MMTITRFVQRYQEIDGPRGADDPSYRTHVVWDNPILAVCREHPLHTLCAEVRCKVGYVNRLYKCVLGGEELLLRLDEVEFSVADALIKGGADSVMADLRKLPDFTNATLKHVVGCHTKLVAIVTPVTYRLHSPP